MHSIKTTYFWVHKKSTRRTYIGLLNPKIDYVLLDYVTLFHKIWFCSIFAFENHLWGEKSGIIEKKKYWHKIHTFLWANYNYCFPFLSSFSHVHLVILQMLLSKATNNLGNS